MLFYVLRTMKVYLATLGCKLNESEMESWTRQFAAQGAEIVHDAREADLCVVNTCTVTQAAARKSRGLIKKIGQAGGNARVVVTGCYATLSPDRVQALPNVSFVVPNSDKERLVALAAGRIAKQSYQMAQAGCRMPEAASGELSTELSASEDLPRPRTRAFVKIEDGCNMSCTYCIIPLARGRARSRAPEEIIGEIAHLVAAGYQEVVLTGVQISDYRLEERDPVNGRTRGLSELAREILARTQLARLRLTSIAPWDLDEMLLDLFADSRLCRHLHLSLQSGSTTALRRMRRPYSAVQFAETVARARERVPDVGITTDVIVGFPGESDLEFEQSLEFIEQMGFARVHVFPYSPRAGTVAAQLPLQVNDRVKESRAKRMQQLADESARRFAERFLGRTLPVLYETEASAPGVWSGYTDNYIRVATRSADNLANRIVPTRLEEVIEDSARGALANERN